MPHIIFVFSLLCQSFLGLSQNGGAISGIVLNRHSGKPLSLVTIEIEGYQIYQQTGLDGSFDLEIALKGDYILSIRHADYITKRIPIQLKGNQINMGIVYLEIDITKEQSDNLISITDSELLDDGIGADSSGLLQATKDVFLTRAAFDLGQAFFKVRGYDAQNGKVLMNGIPMNKFYDGRPQWNNWGGLNDVTSNQEFTNGLAPSEHSFGSILGVTNIDTRPTRMRRGLRISSSASNRTYGARVMATYTSSSYKNRLAYSVSGSRRWAKEGYVEGTLYDAYSFFGVLEYKFSNKYSSTLTGILASNRRGSSSAMTQEVYELFGSRYNPYWGKQDGEIRNSRERKIAEPMLMWNHFYTTKNMQINAGLAYQSGTNSRSRLGYYNAPNSDPTYYRYLPSFYINSPIGANFVSANTAKKGLLANPQLDWNQLYAANKRPQAAYVLYDDLSNENMFTANLIGNFKMNSAFKADLGITYREMKSENYARITDLLGAAFHLDEDSFSNTLNDLNGTSQKKEKDIFNYNYVLESRQIDAFTQVKYEKKRWNIFFAANYSTINYQRNGLFRNERFLENSLGESEHMMFSNYGIKGGLGYKINGRNWISINGALLNRAPLLKNVFINPRENNQIVPKIQSEQVETLDFSYFLRLPKLTGRYTGYYTRFQNTTDVNLFFVDTGLGSDFVQEVLTDLDKLHMGLELGLEYQLSASVQLTAVAAIGKHVFASNPEVAINFDTSGAKEDLINLNGSTNLGSAAIKDYKIAQGPQKAISFGINYRDPKYWWVGLNANYLANNYVNISKITRTQSFYFNPETGLKFPDATAENVSELLLQKPLDDFYLLNVVGGKSWLKKGKYVNVFASINNVFDGVFRTGGYEQSRNGNYGQLKQDNLSGTPSFAPKYWYGYGRTYFLNIALSF